MQGAVPAPAPAPAPSAPAGAPAAPAGAPAPAPLTPLEQRQWRASTQRLFRTTLTSIKEAQSRFEAASEGGEAALTRLCNHALTACLLPSMQLGALGEMQGEGVRQAALDKLLRLAAQELQAVHESVAAVAACAATMARCAEGLEAHACLQPRAPVFSTITLPSATRMVRRISEMYADEAKSKQAVAGAATAHVAAATARYSSSAKGGSRRGQGQGGGQGQGSRGSGAAADTSGMSHAQLQGVCSTWLTCWMLHPFIHEDGVQEVLVAFTEDMAGF